MLRRAAASAARCSRPTVPRPFALNLLPARKINRSFWWRRKPRNLPIYFPPLPKPPAWRRWGATAGRVSLKVFIFTFCFFLVEEFVLDPLFNLFEEFDGLLDDLSDRHDSGRGESDDDDGNGTYGNEAEVVYEIFKYSPRREDGEDEINEEDEDEDEEFDHVEFDGELYHEDADVWNLNRDHYQDGNNDGLGRNNSNKDSSGRNRSNGGDDNDEKNNKKNKDKGDKANSDNDKLNILFIPFPFLMVKAVQPRYTEEDDEYAIYNILHYHTEVRHSLQLWLIVAVRNAIHSNHNIMRVLGSPPIRLLEGELSFGYPARPPAKIYVPGIGFSSDSIFVGYQETNPLTGDLLQSAMYPKAFAQAAWTFLRAFVEQRVHDVGRSLGIKTGATTNAQHPVGSGTNKAQRASGKVGATPFKSTNYGSPEARDALVYLYQSLGGAFPWVWKKLLRAQADDFWREPVNRSLISFAKNWHPRTEKPRRGYVVLRGLLNFTTEKAQIIVKVEGILDFSSNRFTRVTYYTPKIIVYKKRPKQQQLKSNQGQWSAVQGGQQSKQQSALQAKQRPKQQSNQQSEQQVKQQPQDK
ncbi:hypothetical protein CDD81_81 [Ophiocordyceps australis]|uniref:Uncharacterized protein n=1 Tax=Ophiocordyceps australis TaxID=1399860 RepID=A0A2C5XN65_9HYPO|nr:hypothetical protein CDD81_81 [Ophiocordyceps australis]